jgi:hypothetical protein
MYNRSKVVHKALKGSGLVLITFRLIKENKMFTIDTVVDQAVKTAKQSLALVQDAGIKKEFEALVDAQAAYTKTAYNTQLELTKQVVASFGKFDAKSIDFGKFFNFAK